MGRLRVVSLNVQAGGGSRANQIAAAIAAHEPDIAVLSEAYPMGPRGERLSDALARVGLRGSAVAISDSPTIASAVSIFSRSGLEGIRQPIASGANRQRVLEAQVEGMRIVGAYFPLKPLHVPFWRDEFLPYAEEALGSAALLLGDWNTGARDGDAESVMANGSDEFAVLAAMGWVDAWRSRHPDAREYTWYSREPHRNGFRIDHAVASPSLASRVLDVRYDHTTRELGASDHSALVVDLEMGAS